MSINGDIREHDLTPHPPHFWVSQLLHGVNCVHMYIAWLDAYDPLSFVQV